eukprot:3469439-Pyramimonas_sp.AAC.2
MREATPKGPPVSPACIRTYATHSNVSSSAKPIPYIHDNGARLVGAVGAVGAVGDGQLTTR